MAKEAKKAPEAEVADGTGAIPEEMPRAAAPKTRPGRADVYAAIAKASGEIKRIGHDEKNEFHKYGYASVDAFLTACAEPLSANGLALEMDVVSETPPTAPVVDKNGKEKAGLMHIVFRLRMTHSSGQATRWVHRPVAVSFEPPQCYGSAESYVAKRYLRNLLCIPTGDKDDPDAHRKSGSAAPQGAGVGAKEISPKKISAAKKALDAGETADDVRQIWNGLETDLKNHDEVMGHAKARTQSLEAEAAEPPAEKGAAKPPTKAKAAALAKQIGACNTKSELDAACKDIPAAWMMEVEVIETAIWEAERRIEDREADAAAQAGGEGEGTTPDPAEESQDPQDATENL